MTIDVELDICTHFTVPCTVQCVFTTFGLNNRSTGQIGLNNRSKCKTGSDINTNAKQGSNIQGLDIDAHTKRTRIEGNINK